MTELDAFIYDHFVEAGYDPVNTVTYGIILCIAVFFILKIIRVMDVKIHTRFGLALLPFIVFGSTMRVVVDAGFFQGYAPDVPLTPLMFIYWVTSPGLYVTAFVITAVSLYISITAEKRNGIPYHKAMFLMGSIIAAPNVVFIASRIKNIDAVLYIFTLFALIMASVYLIYRLFEIKFLAYEKNYAVLGAHLFDATATFVGVDQLNYGEEHVVPRYFIDLFDTAAVMFPLKIAVLLSVLYVLDRYTAEDRETRRFLKVVIFVLGAGPAIRNMCRILIGV